MEGPGACRRELSGDGVSEPPSGCCLCAGQVQRPAEPVTVTGGSEAGDRLSAAVCARAESRLCSSRELLRTPACFCWIREMQLNLGIFSSFKAFMFQSLISQRP